MFVIYNWKGRWPRRVSGPHLTIAGAMRLSGHPNSADWHIDPRSPSIWVHKDGALRIIPEKGALAAIYGEQERDYE